jgi:hypothetical protein
LLEFCNGFYGKSFRQFSTKAPVRATSPPFPVLCEKSAEERRENGMSEAILSAVNTAGLSLCGIILSNVLAARKNEATIRTAQAVTDTKLEELTLEVREHNHFARRMPVVEEQIKVLNHRVADLEHGAGSAAHFSS